MNALGNGARNEYFYYVAANTGQHLLVGCLLRTGFGSGDKFIVLRRNENSINANGAIVVVVANGHLTLRIGTKISHLLALAADAFERDH